MKKIFLIYIVYLFQINVTAQVNSDSFIRGVDISFTPQIEDLGGKYKVNGVTKDALDIFKESGANYVRLRLWYAPSDGYCGLAKTLDYAKRVKAKGFRFLLDFHYSDWWADPGKQTKPAAWANLSFDVLKDSVYAYTKNVITQLKNQNTLPDMVQIGNEITGGMLWPDGKLYGVPNPEDQWRKFGELLKQGINGVKDAAGANQVKIMIHIDRGGDNNGSIYFYDHLLAQNVNFDVIGLSYYPWWHGTLIKLTNNLNDLAQRYQKEIVVAETAYPWTLQYENDGHGNIVGSNTTLLPSYPATVKGQKDFLFYLSKLIKDTKNGKGIGFFYWEPSYISVPPIGSSWENLTTFDFNGEALESLQAFQNIDSLKSISVRLRINTSTNGDTISVKDFVQIRGEVKGTSSSLLPDGKMVTWDENSQLICKNVGGDYWECQFRMYPGDQLQYKIWTGRNKKTPTYLRLGWEGPILPWDSSNVNARLFTALLDDTTNTVEYFNNNGIQQFQYWSLFQNKTDSVGVLFRVNVSELNKKGLFDPTVNGPITVRGDSVSSANILSWSTNKIMLKREESSVANGSFWSGVVYFPKNKITSGTIIKYKYFIDNTAFGGWESNINDRSFNFPSTDTTLAWKYFNDKIIPTGVEDLLQSVPEKFQLTQNYPNPFNPETTIKFSISERSFVSLRIYNVLGNLVKTLIQDEKEAGSYSIIWNGTEEAGTTVSSGVYFLKLEAGSKNQVRKMVLIR
ncbi:MAG: glycosyl hydrolase 53 family protein [Ignavibacteriales bacterium]|nr:glycosyl hydrolase 53 family protein [Ignavibacteriales bacterium]